MILASNYVKTFPYWCINFTVTLFYLTENYRKLFATLYTAVQCKNTYKLICWPHPSQQYEQSSADGLLTLLSARKVVADNGWHMRSQNLEPATRCRCWAAPSSFLRISLTTTHLSRPLSWVTLPRGNRGYSSSVGRWSPPVGCRCQHSTAAGRVAVVPAHGWPAPSPPVHL